MNLPLRQAASQQRGDSGAGAGIGAGAQARPAHPDYIVGAVGFGANWQDDEASLRQMYEQACRTIVRLECEKDELAARVAVLEEEQKILAKGMAPRLTDEDDYVQLTDKGRAWLEAQR